MPRPRRTRAAAAKQVEALRHEQDTRTNVPTAEYQSLVREEQEAPLRTAYLRRNRNGDPQQCAALEQWLQDVARGYGHRILPIEERVTDTWGKLYYTEMSRWLTACWLPGVNALGQYGRWAFAELTDVYDIGSGFQALIAETLRQKSGPDSGSYERLSFKEMLAAGPLEGVDLERPVEYPREIDF